MNSDCSDLHDGAGRAARKGICSGDNAGKAPSGHLAGEKTGGGAAELPEGTAVHGSLKGIEFLIRPDPEGERTVFHGRETGGLAEILRVFFHEKHVPEGGLLFPGPVMELRGEQDGQPGFVSRAVRLKGEGDLDDAVEIRLPDRGEGGAALFPEGDFRRRDAQAAVSLPVTGTVGPAQEDPFRFPCAAVQIRLPGRDFLPGRPQRAVAEEGRFFLPGRVRGGRFPSHAGPALLPVHRGEEGFPAQMGHGAAGKAGGEMDDPPVSPVILKQVAVSRALHLL